MRTSQTEATYALLIDYAGNQALRQEFTATQAVISEWTGIPPRTLRRHVSQLVAQGKLSIRYTGDGIVYSLPDGVVKIPRIREVITDRGVYHDGDFPGESFPWYSGYLEHAGLEVQYGNADPGYVPAKWSDTWSRFFAACSDHNNELAEEMIFNRNREAITPGERRTYEGVLPF